jgi:hypothetical protein
MTLIITTTCHYAECRDLFIAILRVIMLSVVMLNVVAPKIGTLRVFVFYKNKPIEGNSENVKQTKSFGKK